METTALVGTAPDGGATQFLPAAAPASSVNTGHGFLGTKQMGKGFRWFTRSWGRERATRERRGLAPSPGNGGALPRPTPVPARNSGRERERFDREQRGKRVRGSRAL